MIKLNNKNITYVALADSSSSLKAPKEIWYADTNNSVKLVYRRKDALIEGEDYEKYHFMRVIVNDTSSSSVAIYLPINSSTFNYTSIIEKGNNIGHLDTNGYWYYTLDATNKDIRVWDKTNRMTPENTNVGSNVMVFNSNSNEFTVNNIQITKYGFPVKGKCFYCRGEWNGSILTSPISVNGFTKYVPVKLLKHVPKWLDANGIRRNVGDCGMIDLETGKFRGATNDYGTISVVNYYERKEWLQGRNGAYIDTNYYPIVGTDVFSVHFHYDGTRRNPDGVEQCIFGCQNGPYGPTVIRAYINSANNLSVAYRNVSDNNFPQTGVNSNNWEIADLKLAESNFSFIANGVTYTFSNNDVQIETMPNSIWVFKNLQTYNSNCYFHGDIAYFKITDTSSNTKMNLIPCTLTMDLPASMDANNIARTKGTSGMWDLVSDRFYGNVANSGTFNAVNLAEGVDYEVHQWIIGDNVAYIDGLDYNLWQNTLQIQIGKVDGNCQYFGLNILYNSQTRNGSHFQLMSSGGIFKTYFRDIINGQGWVGWFNLNDMPSVVTFEYYIEDNKAVAIVNGVKTYDTVSSNTLTESVWNKYVPLNTKDGNNIYTKLAKVSYIRELLPNGTYRSNLIPVKLLRSLPSKYDANGIARNAGECGMYDTVNDIFYGNVASSGTFSVSDDS